MKKALIGLFLLAGLASAAAQPLPTTLPPNTVVGRLGITAGPAQAIPFSVLTSSLFGMQIDAQTGTTYTIPSADNRKLLTGTNASAQAYALPQAGSAGFPLHWQTTVCSYGT